MTVDITPAEKWYNRKTDLSHLQKYGSVVYKKISVLSRNWF